MPEYPSESREPEPPNRYESTVPDDLIVDIRTIANRLFPNRPLETIQSVDLMEQLSKEDESERRLYALIQGFQKHMLLKYGDNMSVSDVVKVLGRFMRRREKKLQRETARQSPLAGEATPEPIPTAQSEIPLFEEPPSKQPAAPETWLHWFKNFWKKNR